MKKVAKLAKVFIFLVIFFYIYNIIFANLHMDKDTISYFYDEPKESMDIMYLGSSNAYTHFNTVLAYHEYGFTTGLLSSDNEPLTAIKYLINESQKSQDPKLYIIDISIANNITSVEGGIRKVIDAMPPSLNRLNATSYILKYSDIPKTDYLNFYFRYVLYHGRWKEYNKDLGELMILYKGHLLSSQTVTTEKQENFVWNDERGKLSKEQEDVVNDLLDYIKKNNLNVLFVVAPRTYYSDDLKQLNNIIKIIEDEDFEVLNFNKMDDISFNYQTDFYNYAHLNAYAAKRFTLYFSDYLKNRYALPDHRGDKKYKSWDEEYDRYLKDFNMYTKENFEDIEVQDIKKEEQ